MKIHSIIYSQGIYVLLLLDNHKKMEESVGNCPVCRRRFLAKDLDHVLALVGSHSSQLVSYLFQLYCMGCK